MTARTLHLAAHGDDQLRVPDPTDGAEHERMGRLAYGLGRTTGRMRWSGEDRWAERSALAPRWTHAVLGVARAPIRHASVVVRRPCRPDGVATGPAEIRVIDPAGAYIRSAQRMALGDRSTAHDATREASRRAAVERAREAALHALEAYTVDGEVRPVRAETARTIVDAWARTMSADIARRQAAPTLTPNAKGLRKRA